MIDSGNSFNMMNYRPSSAMSNITHIKKYDASLNDGSYFQSPVNNGNKQIRYAYNPSIDSGYNPNSVTEVSYNPFEAHMRRLSQNLSNEGRPYENVNKSAFSINDNDKSMTPDYIGEYNARAIEHIGKRKSILPSFKILFKMFI